MKKGKLISAIIVLSASIAGVSSMASAAIGGGSGAMAAAVNQANDARDYVGSLMTNITTQFNATHAITAAYPRIPRDGSGSIERVYSDRNGVITVKYKSRGISGPLQDVVLTFTPQHSGKRLNPARDVNIDDWTCTYRASPKVRGQRQYGVLHNIFVYVKYPLNICVKQGGRGRNHTK
ncbi:MAG: hypothetical protein GY821_02180 [Gammaproteobacteria bacterium]|nr:hypothetical protein [Gammaproteobacteria bacterium]